MEHLNFHIQKDDCVADQLPGKKQRHQLSKFFVQTRKCSKPRPTEGLRFSGCTGAFRKKFRDKRQCFSLTNVSNRG